jgi:hypothetical protein
MLGPFVREELLLEPVLRSSLRPDARLSAVRCLVFEVLDCMLRSLKRSLTMGLTTIFDHHLVCALKSAQVQYP